MKKLLLTAVALICMQSYAFAEGGYAPGNAPAFTATGTGANKLPAGTTAQRPTAAEGQIRDNTTLGQIEAYVNGAWITLGGAVSSTINLASQVTGILPKANGGTGTATPALVAGTNVTITGTWPNQTIAASGSGGGVTSLSGDGSLYTNSSSTGAVNLTLGSQTANRVLIAPNGSNGTPTFRALVAADVPTLNQNTTGSAVSFTGSLVGDVTGTQSATTIPTTTVTSKALIGFLATTGTVTATDTILTAINKIVGNINALVINLASQVTGTLATTNGGTGLATIGTANQVLMVNSGGTALTYGTVSGGGGSIGGTTGQIEYNNGSVRRNLF